jgi:hypothetical protein
MTAFTICVFIILTAFAHVPIVKARRHSLRGNAAHEAATRIVAVDQNLTQLLANARIEGWMIESKWYPLGTKVPTQLHARVSLSHAIAPAVIALIL